MQIRSNIVNDSDAEQTVTVRTTLKHPDSFEAVDGISYTEFNPEDMYGGGVVETYDTTLVIPAGGSSDFTHDLSVQNPHLWNGTSDPYRYQVGLEVYIDGERVDNLSDYVGFRFYSVDYDNGFYLNGESYPLRGVSRHQDREDMGNAITDAEQDEDFALIYEIGANSVRLAHYPQASYFYDLCDKYGIVVWAEIPFVNGIGGTGSYESPDADRQAFFDVTKQQLVELIRQQFNRPSICFWGLENEVVDNDGVMPEFMSDLNDLAHAEDPTRLTTQATDKSDAENWASDLIAWNRYPGWYFGTKEDMGADLDTNHAADTRPMAISEYGIGANIATHVDEATNADKSLNVQTEEYQSLCHESFIEQINARPYLWATYVWNMFDFSSDWRSEGGLQGVNTKGLVTRDRQTKKDSFYLYKANWSSDPFVHINSSRNNPRENSPIQIKGYSNCDSVELTVNGTVIGTLTQDQLAQRTVFVWDGVPLQSGTNTVVMTAVKDGKTYTDTVVWDKEASSDTSLRSDVLTVDNDGKVIALSGAASVGKLAELIQSYDATLELFESDGVTPVVSGSIRAGMILKVTSEDGTQTAVYTFTAGILSLGKTVTVSSYQDNKDGNNPPEYMTDGDDTTRWAASLSDNGTSTTYPQWAVVDLGEACSLERIDISWFQSSTQRKYYYTVSVSEDGLNYTQVVDRTQNDTSGLVSDLLSGVKGRYVRIDITGNSNWPSNASAAASIYEIKVYGAGGTAADPSQLQELYDQCEDMVDRYYTEESWDAFNLARSNAATLLERSDATQEEIDAAFDALDTAYQAILTQENTVIRGDVDNDRQATVSDVVTMRDLIMTQGYTDRQLTAGDLNGDNQLTVSDVVDLRNLIIKGS